MQTSSETRTSFLEKLEKSAEKPLYSLLSIMLGFGVAIIIILIIGGNPLQYIADIFNGNFNSLESFGNLLANLSWIILVGLSVAISFRAGLFNIGVSGQMIAGGIAGYFWAHYADVGDFLGVFMSILIPMVVGMIIASLIGFLKTSFGINEVISSIMINWTVYELYKYFTNSSYSNNFVDTSTGATIAIDHNSLRVDWLTNLFGGDSYINIGIFIAIAALIIVALLYAFTVWGAKQNIIGDNPKAAKYVGMKEKRELIKTMAFSGALAGLAGAVFYLGIKLSLPAIGADIPGEGFNGITVSLIAFNNPMGIFFSSLFVAMLYNSKLIISIHLNPSMSDLILGIIIFIIAFSQFMIIYKPFDRIMNRKSKTKMVAKTQTTGGATPETVGGDDSEESASITLAPLQIQVDDNKFGHTQTFETEQNKRVDNIFVDKNNDKQSLEAINNLQKQIKDQQNTNMDDYHRDLSSLTASEQILSKEIERELERKIRDIVLENEYLQDSEFNQEAEKFVNSWRETKEEEFL